MQLLAHLSGGNVTRADRREYGRANVRIEGGRLFRGFGAGEETPVWMSHGDHVDQPPPGYRVTASSLNSPIAAFEHKQRPLFGVQFHPEVAHTPRRRNPQQLPVRGVRLHPGLDPGAFRGDRGRPDSGARRSQPAGDMWPLGWGGFVRRRGVGAPRGRRPAHLHLRGPRAAATPRAGAGGTDLPAASRDRPEGG